MPVTNMLREKECFIHNSFKKLLCNKAKQVSKRLFQPAKFKLMKREMELKNARRWKGLLWSL